VSSKVQETVDPKIEALNNSNPPKGSLLNNLDDMNNQTKKEISAVEWKTSHQDKAKYQTFGLSRNQSEVQNAPIQS